MIAHQGMSMRDARGRGEMNKHSYLTIFMTNPVNFVNPGTVYTHRSLLKERGHVTSFLFKHFF